MVLAAWLRRIPAALTEADAHVGLANRLATPFVDRVFLAYPDERANGKTRVVGRPIPWALDAHSQAEARRALGLPDDGLPLVLVFGGSQGARSLNETAVGAWGAEGPHVLHLSGERDYAALRSRVTRDDYVLLPFIDDFGTALAAADLVVARSGGSVWEIAAAGRPAVLVPYPHATSNHQLRNAEYFARAGGARIVPDEAARARVPALVAELLADPGALRRMSDAMRAAAKPDAADQIADELVALATARR
jgi:UDP-N-acetylglucosamine--N-acetylmuramyl-(pentapeptide) pyrophosphoryl-undecaprenol N-acetylglucosamine transferase